MPGRECDDQFTMNGRRCATGDNQADVRCALELRDTVLDLVDLLHVDRGHLKPQRHRRGLDRSPLADPGGANDIRSTRCGDSVQAPSARLATRYCDPSAKLAPPSRGSARWAPRPPCGPRRTARPSSDSFPPSSAKKAIVALSGGVPRRDRRAHRDRRPCRGGRQEPEVGQEQAERQCGPLRRLLSRQCECDQRITDRRLQQDAATGGNHHELSPIGGLKAHRCCRARKRQRLLP
jgi:hypothetical protein